MVAPVGEENSRSLERENVEWVWDEFWTLVIFMDGIFAINQKAQPPIPIDLQ